MNGMSSIHLDEMSGFALVANLAESGRLWVPAMTRLSPDAIVFTG